MIENSRFKLLGALFLINQLNQSDREGKFYLTNDFLKEFLGAGYSQKVYQEVKGKLILKEKGLPLSIYQLTYLGKNKLLQRFPALEFFNLDPTLGWNRQFNFVTFNVPEALRPLRDRLRYHLEILGFGKVNRSLYLTPHLTLKEINHLLLSLRPHPEVEALKNDWAFAFSVSLENLKGEEESRLLSFWDLRGVADCYERALAFWSVSQGPTPLAVSASFISKFLQGFLKDPFLPPEILPKNWVGFEALKIAQEVFLRKG